MPNYTTLPTEKLVFLLRKWQEENKRKPTRATMARIIAIRTALATKRSQ